MFGNHSMKHWNHIVAKQLFLAGCLMITIVACTNNKQGQMMRFPEIFTDTNRVTMADSNTVATFGAGCFWCVEAIFQRLEGVQSVVSGFSGGSVKNPTYQQVISGTTGHAEVVHIQYDSEKVTFGELLEVFWMTHDPTTPNRQGADVGTQYRSAVFFHNEEQKRLAHYYKDRLDKAGVFTNKIVTEITPFEAFYPAEDYHQNYFNNNPNQAYCAFVIRPKLDKFKEVFSDKLVAQP